ncbi:hypothetical protein JKF63_00012 [Porcisia hertigi]|uniref:Protein kinase n=1 Tax=Porcisia hertigi TaxID=2761500 RepID=A0A836I7H4_9TRYP|nr:hypothetical protein JKF63_00012 [Porcisia hertigi]
MLKQLTQTVASAFSYDALYAYVLETSSTTLCGRHNLFERCDAVVRASGKKVSIFTLRTKQLLKHCTAEEAVALIRAVKESVALLTKMRHPAILSIDGHLIEDKKKIWFATERVSMVLSPETVQGLDLQVKLLGLYHCAEAIRFLHERTELLLFNFALSSIYVTEDKQWKVGDLCFAMPRAQINAPPVPFFPFRSVAAPLLNYLPTEYVEFCTPASGGANRDRFSLGAAPLVFPDSDTYSFLVVTVEVLEERLMSNYDSDSFQQRQSTIETYFSRYFPAEMLRLPRPSIATVVQTGPFSTPDMRALKALFSFDTLDSDMRFGVLKALYTGLMEGNFCEAVIMSSIVPLMVRESRTDAMLRFVLPILLVCTNAVSTGSFDRVLRPYFVSLLTAITCAPSLERVTVYAEQVLQRREGIHKHFASLEDRAKLIVPLILKLMNCDGNGRLQKGSLEWFRDVLTHHPATELGLPADIPTHLFHIVLSNVDLFALIFECLERILAFATTETKIEVEVGLVRSISNMSTLFTPGQLNYLLRLLKDIQGTMTLEHRATKSIPLLCPLLLHTDETVKLFAVGLIVGYAQLFGRGSLPPPPPSGSPLPSSVAATSAALPAFVDPSKGLTLPPSVPPPPKSTGDDVFAALFS